MAEDKFKRLSFALAGLLFLLCAITVAAWVVEIPGLTPFFTAVAPRRMNTVIGFVLIAAALFLLNAKKFGRNHTAARVCAAMAAAIGFLTLVQYVLSIDIGIDHVFVAIRSTTDPTNPFPSRMAPLTAFGLMLEGLALLFLDVRKRRHFSQTCLALALTVAVGGLVGHLYGARDLYRISIYSSMSVSAAFGLALAAMAILFARPEFGIPALLARRTHTGILARRLLPAAISAPIVLGWLAVAGDRLGFYEVAFGTGVFAVALAGLFVALVCWTALAIERSDQERQAAENELRKREERLRFMAEAMPQKIFTAGAGGGIGYFNQQWTDFTGAEMQRIRDWGWLQFIHPDDVQETIHRWKQSIDSGKDFQIEHRFYRKDSTYRWHLSRARAMRDREGNVLMWIGSNTEIHDQKLVQQELLRAKERADRANRSKDEFLAVVSHELRTPLTSILGWARLLLEGNLDKQSAVKALSAIDRNAAAQAQLIEDLLDVARMITGKFGLTITEVDVPRVISASVASVTPAANAKQISIERTIEGKPRPIAGDPIRLQQVFWNLLNNSIKFSPKGSRIEVRLIQTATDLRVIFKDEGRGIDAAFLPHVFERFRQEDATTTRQHGGLGLGLAIVRYLVEAHGGSVRVESAGLEQGTTFTVDLPVENVATQQDQLDYTAAVEGERGLSGLRLLAVEDDTDARELVRTILAAAGASVIAVPSADEALAELDLGVPDVLVADVGMPDKDGYQLLREIRLRDETRGGQVPAIALTAYARNEDRMMAIKAGFQMYLSKPVDPTGLVHAVARLAAASAK